MRNLQKIAILKISEDSQEKSIGGVCFQIASLLKAKLYRKFFT